jgi:hypothetical protein
MARAVKENPLVALPLLLLAHVFERVAQRLNRRLQRRLDVPPL